MTPALLEEREEKLKLRKPKRCISKEQENKPLSIEEANLLGWRRKLADDPMDEYVLQMVEKATRDVERMKKRD